MDNQDLKSILQDALEESLPVEQIKLWPGIQAHLAAGNCDWVFHAWNFQ